MKCRMRVSFDLELLNDGNLYLSAKKIKESGIGKLKDGVWELEVIE